MAALLEDIGQENHQRRLSGTSHGQVSHTDDPAGEVLLLEEASGVENVACRDGSAIGNREEAEDGAEEGGPA